MSYIAFTACPEGRYGYNCEEHCNINCEISYRCDRVTGKCDGGCQVGWEGATCDIRTQSFFYVYQHNFFNNKEVRCNNLNQRIKKIILIAIKIYSKFCAWHNITFIIRYFNFDLRMLALLYSNDDFLFFAAFCRM